LRLVDETTTNLLSGAHGLAWMPSGPDLVARVARWAGFAAIREVYWDKKEPRGIRRNPGRCCLIAARFGDVLEQFDAAVDGETARASCARPWSYAPACSVRSSFAATEPVGAGNAFGYSVMLFDVDVVLCDGGAADARSGLRRVGLAVVGVQAAWRYSLMSPL